MSKDLKKILTALKFGDISEEEAIHTINQLFHAPIKTLNLPEIINCVGIPPQQIQKKIAGLMDQEKAFIAIKANEDVFNYVRLNVPDIFFYDEGHVIFSKPPAINNLHNNKISVLSTNFTDPVAVEEAYIVSRMCGIEAYKHMDIGQFGENLTENDHEILKNTQFIIYVTSGYHPNIDWLQSTYHVPVILVPIIKKDMLFMEQMNIMSSVLFSGTRNVLRTSFNAAGDAALVASQLLLSV
ncbi:MAG: hypothetical protein Kow00108_13050 [Calditrichia bacterium]